MLKDEVPACCSQNMAIKWSRWVSIRPSSMQCSWMTAVIQSWPWFFVSINDMEQNLCFWKECVSFICCETKLTRTISQITSKKLSHWAMQIRKRALQVFLQFAAADKDRLWNILLPKLGQVSVSESSGACLALMAADSMFRQPPWYSCSVSLTSHSKPKNESFLTILQADLILVFKISPGSHAFWTYPSDINEPKSIHI